jgi:hypothetical protein
MWNKLDDKLHSHRKPRKAGLEAMGLWAVCLSYCGDQLTDGFVPAWYVQTWVPGRRGIKLAEQLVDAELWERAALSGENGWLFHDYLLHNPSRDEVLANREFERQRKAEQRKRAREQEMSQWDSPRDSQWVSGDPDPTRPDQTRSGGPSCPGVVGKSGTAHARAREAEPPMCARCEAWVAAGYEARPGDNPDWCRGCNDDARHAAARDEAAEA